MKTLKITFEVEVTGERADVFIENQKRLLEYGEYDDFGPYGTGRGHKYGFDWKEPIIEVID